MQHFLDPDGQRFLLDEESLTSPEQAAAIVDFYLERPDAPYNRRVIVRRDDGAPMVPAASTRGVAFTDARRSATISVRSSGSTAI